jgi:hypothetical protein
VRTIGDDERRARLGVRHLLAAPGASPEDAAVALVGLHSTDPSSVYLETFARVSPFKSGDLEDALYERRSLVRMLGMRRTLFVVPRDFAAVMDEACAKALAAAERRRLVRMLEEQEVVPSGRGGRWVDRVAKKTLDALAARGEATARQLTTDVPELANKLVFGEGRRWAGTMGVSTRILFLLATRGAIVRARPLGSWTSGQYRWARIDDWLGQPLGSPGHGEACAQVVRRYLRAFGPATMTDLRWWTGWTAKLSAASLAGAGAVEVPLAHGTGYLLPDDLDPVDPPDPWVALLPSLDATVMGWKERDWYLGPHAGALFDRSGNAGPTVMVDGRALGAWTQRKDGTIVTELLEQVPARTRRRIDAESERLRDWLGDVRWTPRFRTTLESRLSSA